MKKSCVLVNVAISDKHHVR